MADIVVITGASRGIGAACARKAASAGFGVVVNYVADAGAANAIAGEIEAAGGIAMAVQADVGKPDEIGTLFAAADRLGRLRGLVNNAGIVAPGARVDELSPERITRMLAVNVTGSILCAKAAVLRMSERHGGQGGSIVNMGSLSTRLGGAGKYVDYAASKGAIDAFTIGLAREVAAEGIRVNAVRPGVIDTEIHASGGEPDRADNLRAEIPMQRAGSAEEVADSVMWLLGDNASYVTGAIIDVGGGR